MNLHFLFLCITVAVFLPVVYCEDNVDYMHIFNQLKPHPSNLSLCNSRLRAMRQATGSASPSPAAEICITKSKKSIFVFGNCPKVCYPTLLTGFLACAPFIQFGCQLKEGSAKTDCRSGFTCELDPVEIEEANTVCPGDKVVFTGINIKEAGMLSYSIDLNAKPTVTDFYMLFDATGSMGGSIAAAKANAGNILNVFGDRGNVGFGIGFYRDEAESGLPVGGFVNVEGITPITNKRGRRLTGGENRIRNAINGLVASGGGDRDEANLVALYKVATDSSIGWRKKSRRIVVLFGDQPGHEPTCALPGLTLTRTNVVKKLKDTRISVIVVDFANLDGAPRSFGCSPSSVSGTGQGSFIASGTDGSRVAGLDQAATLAAIEKGLGDLKKVFNVDTSKCDNFLDSMHVPELNNFKLSAGESTLVKNTFKIKPEVCDGGSKFKCKFRYTESGASLPDINLQFVKIKGC